MSQLEAPAKTATLPTSRVSGNHDGVGRKTTASTQIEAQHLETYLRGAGYPDAEILHLTPLGLDTQEGLKAYGYGRPLRVNFRSGGQERDLVVRTMSPDPFGHVLRAERGAVLLMGFDTFNECPRHIRAVDVGAFADQGQMVPMARGELFLVTTYVEGELYANDLHKLQQLVEPRPVDVARTTALAKYLADLHAHQQDPGSYIRVLRDTLGSGEGIFGQTDAYPADHPVATAERLMAIEQAAVRWRWRLRDKARRAKSTHGDFHPFNILFRDGDDFSVLDCSRGGRGEAADDVTCLCSNYLFFSVAERGRFDGALRMLWDHFWDTYLEASGDTEILEVVAPFFAWRVLVLASPVWYPDLADGARDRLLKFAEHLLDDAPFTPRGVDELLG